MYIYIYFFAFNISIVSIERMTTSVLCLSSPDISRARIQPGPGGTEERGFRGPGSHLCYRGCIWETEKTGERYGLWPLLTTYSPLIKICF